MKFEINLWGELIHEVLVITQVFFTERRTLILSVGSSGCEVWFHSLGEQLQVFVGNKKVRGKCGCSHLLMMVPRSRIFLPWRCRRYIPPKRQFTQDMHSATSQKTAFFELLFVNVIIKWYIETLKYILSVGRMWSRRFGFRQWNPLERSAVCKWTWNPMFRRLSVLPPSGVSEYNGRVCSTPFSGGPDLVRIPKISCLDWGVSWFSLVPPVKCWCIPAFDSKGL
jgi:hypothetical protein